MVHSVRARWAFAASLLLMLAFAWGIAADLVHTDDGCQVETHCLACQRVLGSVGIGATAPSWYPSIELVGRVEAGNDIAILEPDAPAIGSRAPPLA
jgi:hypothetical protein